MIEKLKVFYKKYDFILLTFLLGIILFIIFCPVINYDLINFDDNILVYENEEITYLDFKTVNKFFSKSYHSLYHPLVYISFALDYKMTNAMNPYVFHSTNFLLHVFNSLLILLLIYLLIKNIKIAFIVAILFAIHPMHVEPVVWISGRKELLCAFFYFLSFIFYVLYKTKEANKKIFYILTVMMFLCSLFSKVMAVTLPAVLILYDYIFVVKKPTVKSFFTDKSAFFILSGIFIIIALFSAETSADGIFILDIFKNIYRAAFQYSFYIVKFFLPVNLSIIYPSQMEYSGFLYSIFVPLFILFWAYISIIAFKKTKPIFFGLMFYTITIFPVLNLIPFGLEIAADRFTYIPYVGLFYSLIVFVRQINSTVKRKTTLILLCLFTCSSIVLSRIRVGEWENNIPLFSKAIERQPTYIAYTNRGAAYYDVNEYEYSLTGLWH